MLNKQGFFLRPASELNTRQTRSSENGRAEAHHAQFSLKLVNHIFRARLTVELRTQLKKEKQRKNKQRTFT